MPAPTFGLKASQQGATIDEARQIWAVAEEGGFDGCWVFDHLAALGPDRTVDVFEAWTFMAAMAQATKRMRVGCLVFDNTRRHPGLFAKMAATVDHISGGRLDIGLGAGGDELVDGMLGLPVDRIGKRIDRLSEACRVLKLLWTEMGPSFESEHYRLVDAIANPKPIQRPHPPLWVAGTGERGLGVVAEHADVWIGGPWGSQIDELIRLSASLDRHCVEIGRDPATIRRASQVSYSRGEESEVLRVVEANLTAGFTEIVLLVRSGGWPSPVAASESAAELLPSLRALG
jgi:alkanesulfonate monooxygenase SsuD/methylene tetrahydromethanopterin reductase-like flavin-dependent oxidoreductase (luciferase family)